jgi:hypothetical protein
MFECVICKESKAEELIHIPLMPPEGKTEDRRNCPIETVHVRCIKEKGEWDNNYGCIRFPGWVLNEVMADTIKDLEGLNYLS